EFPSYYSPYYIRISILNKKDKDNNYEEAHIYLPNETYLLPNHFTLPFKIYL
ncbi:20570_t:CDS:1, partial [Dentiscutata erythropus]